MILNNDNNNIILIKVHAEALLQRQPDQIGDKMQFDEWNVFFV